MSQTRSEQNNSNVMIEMNNVVKSYSTAAGETHALKNITWQINSGEALAIMGPSGCGKTTLLNLIGSMDRVSQGNIVVDGQDVTKMTERQSELYRLKKVGFIFQFFNLVPSLSAIENMQLPMILAGVPKDERLERCQNLLDTIGLGEKGHKRPEELSGGEQQRVAVCLALVNDPDLILADEPTGNLDVANMEIISNLLISLAKERGKTVVVATHDQKMGSAFPKIYRMRDGQFESRVDSMEH
ncbi:MAG: ABC transporter ATP-binding protein [Gammaproteobacteria bacterium]|nr:ABC transporter ATP-binding protein [Gammaproteobacteria bacterium]